MMSRDLTTYWFASGIDNGSDIGIDKGLNESPFISIECRQRFMEINVFCSSCANCSKLSSAQCSKSRQFVRLRRLITSRTSNGSSENFGHWRLTALVCELERQLTRKTSSSSLESWRASRSCSAEMSFFVSLRIIRISQTFALRIINFNTSYISVLIFTSFLIKLVFTAHLRVLMISLAN